MTRPVCVECGSPAPLINRRCLTCMDVVTEASLHCVSAEDVLAEGRTQTKGLIG